MRSWRTYDSIPEFNYLSFHGAPSVCQIDRWDDLVLCTELDRNPGTSVTNRAEELATQVAKHFGIAPTSLVWIERYEYRPTVFDQVAFAWDGEHFRPPVQWRRLSVSCVKDLLALDLPPSLQARQAGGDAC